MHELSLAEAMVEQVSAALEKENGGRVTRLTVVIGALSGVEREAFEFAFPLAAEQTPLEHAELVVEERPVTVCCGACDAESHPEPICLVCEHCGSMDVRITGGREFLVREMEILQAESP